MLPQVDVPLIEIEMFSTKDIVNFRPFLVKEEKMLVMASETNDINDMMKATQQIITNCSFGKVEGDKLPLFELQYIFLKLRSASISNAIDLNMVCGDCGTQYNHQLNLEDLELTLDEDHKNPIKLSKTMAVEMKYPDAKEMAKLLEGDNNEAIYALVAKSIKTIYDDDEVIECDEISETEMYQWVENLPATNFENIREFFETMPALEHLIEFKCANCGKENYLNLNGYVNFFV